MAREEFEGDLSLNLKEKNISDLEKQLRLAEMSVPAPVEFGFMALPKRNRLPSRAKTAAAQLRQLGCLADSSRRAVSALHARPISGARRKRVYFRLVLTMDFSFELDFSTRFLPWPKWVEVQNDTR